MGEGDGFIGTQTHLLHRFSFSSDFGHFILKMQLLLLENAKSTSKSVKYRNFWGTSPAGLSTARDVSPRPPAFGAHV